MRTKTIFDITIYNKYTNNKYNGFSWKINTLLSHKVSVLPAIFLNFLQENCPVTDKNYQSGKDFWSMKVNFMFFGMVKKVLIRIMKHNKNESKSNSCSTPVEKKNPKTENHVY